MLFPSEMAKITIFVHKKDSENVIKALHESGMMEISKVTNKEVKESKMHPDVGVLASYELRLSRIIEILKNYDKKKKGIKNILKKKALKKKVKKRSLEEKINDAKNILNEIESIVLESEKKINEIDEKIEHLEDKKQKVKYLALFDINVEWLGKSKYLIIKFGISTDLTSLKNKDFVFYYRNIGKKKEKRWAVLIVSHVSNEEELNKLKNFEEIQIEGKGKARELLKEIDKEIENLKKEKKKIRKNLAEIYKQRKLELFAIREEIQIEKERKEVHRNFGETNFTFLIEGWCLAEDAEEVRKVVENSSNGNAAIIVKKVKRAGSSSNPAPPTHLKNPKWAKPFETFLELFSLPKYEEINPTIFLGISFIIFFSVMLGDAGYGLVIFLLSLIAYLKFKESEFIRKWAFLGIWLGVGNIVTGFLFNGFFGDLIPRFIYRDTDRMIYSANIFGITLPIDAIHKPVIILTIALILGLIHLNLGILLGLYQNIVRKRIKKAFEEQISWFIFEIGGGMLIGDALLDLWHLSTQQKIIAFIFVIIGLISLFKRKGAVGFFEITGFVGDWLSYARLLALGLATAGMALAFNVVADLLPTILPYIGIILAPLLLIFAHFANLLIQSLGAAIHALRLQYVEFFNRFYEGGGKKFMPFRIKRKYTEEIR